MHMRLISFGVSNFRSFRNKQEIRFGKNGNVDAMFGPNGSGKTNLCLAMMFFGNFIRMSSRYQGGQWPYLAPFELSNDIKEEVEFEAEFSSDLHQYKYGFSICKNRVSKERLLRLNSLGKYDTMFSRASVSKRAYDKFGFTPELLRQTRDETLLLTKAWENNNDIAKDVFSWLDHFHIIRGGQVAGATARRVFKDVDFKKKVLEFLRNADLGIEDVNVREVEVPPEVLKVIRDQLPDDLLESQLPTVSYQVQTAHLVRDNDGGVAGVKQFDMTDRESSGTQQMFGLSMPIIDTIESGGILYVDEFEMYLHPKECEFIISLFDKNRNQKGAQLILNTQNTGLMDVVGREGVHLFAKDGNGGTVIGQVSNTIVRPGDKSIRKKYDNGLLGAVVNIRL